MPQPTAMTEQTRAKKTAWSTKKSRGCLLQTQRREVPGAAVFYHTRPGDELGRFLVDDLARIHPDSDDVRPLSRPRARAHAALVIPVAAPRWRTRDLSVGRVGLELARRRTVTE